MKGLKVAATGGMNMYEDLLERVDYWCRLLAVGVIDVVLSVNFHEANFVY